MWYYKEGVIISGLNNKFFETKWTEIANLVSDIAKATPTITAGVDGKHSEHSQHYLGLAIDCRIRDWKCDVTTLAKVIARTLGCDYVVVQERDHLHIQIGRVNVVGNLERVGLGYFIKSVNN